jgi:preprotein translocase subunit SecA
MSDAASRSHRFPIPPAALPHGRPGGLDPAINDSLSRLRAHASLLLAPLRAKRARMAAEHAVALADDMRRCDDRELTVKARQLGPRLLRTGLRDELVAEGMALVREACRRFVGLEPFPEQLMAGYALLHGAAVEMDTGEGKTLTSLVPSVVHALSGRFVHVIAPNDYLAERDGSLLRPAIQALGLSVGIVVHDMPPPARRTAYATDITFVSNKEVAFDYLRDRLLSEEIAGDRNVHFKVRKVLNPTTNKVPPIMRGLDVAIVDEIDSVLIDDAGTPLLISTDSDTVLDPETARVAAEIAAGLEEPLHFRTDLHGIGAELTPHGEEVVGHATADLPGLWRQRIRRHEIARAAITAHHCLQRDRHYLVRDDRVIIIDENTGRTMPDRYWGHDLHLMVELKEGCSSTGLRKSLASISFQRFFRSYRTLCGMSGTVREVAVELAKVYDLALTPVPRRLPLQRRFLGRELFQDRDALWRRAARLVDEISRGGQPVLIGVRSVREAKCGSRALLELGIQHTVLSAAHDKQEAEIVARAGGRGVVTIATNMAGRGTDIKLATGVAEAGGLVVVICERHDSRRVDRQLMGRCARQGDPGAVIELVSREDIILRSASRWFSSLMDLPHIGPFATALVYLQAQRRIERLQSRRRLDLVRRDEKLRRMLAFAGGLD